MGDGPLANVTLVGVAGVGKTTLGALAAGELGMDFIDIDVAFEEAEGADIDALIERYGEEGYDRRLFGFLADTVGVTENAIIAVPARLMSSRRLWEVMRARAVTIHLRGEPMEVYRRHDIRVDGRKVSDEEKREAGWVREFLDYYHWRVRHCERAGHTVRVEGDKARDAGRLCRAIREAIRARDTQGPSGTDDAGG